MKLTKKLTVFTLFALLATLSTATLFAQLGPRHGRSSGAHQGGPFGEFMLERIALHLDLSEQQREQIRAVHEVYREDVELLGQTMRVARHNLDDQTRGESFDETAIRAAAEQVAAVQADLAVLRARIHSDAHQILNPDQIEWFKAGSALNLLRKG